MDSSLFTESFTRSELGLVEPELPVGPLVLFTPLLLLIIELLLIVADVPFSFSFESSDLSDWDAGIPLPGQQSNELIMIQHNDEWLAAAYNCCVNVCTLSSIILSLCATWVLVVCRTMSVGNVPWTLQRTIQCRLKVNRTLNGSWVSGSWL